MGTGLSCCATQQVQSARHIVESLDAIPMSERLIGKSHVNFTHVSKIYELQELHRQDRIRNQKAIKIQKQWRRYMLQQKRKNQGELSHLQTTINPTSSNVPIELDEQNYIEVLEIPKQTTIAYKLWSSLTPMHCKPSVSPHEQILQYDDRSIFVGVVEQGIRTGYGVYFKEDTSIEEGIWENDQLVGTIRIVYPNGDYYEGDIQDDQKDGYGSFININGGYFRGLWVKGQLDGYCEEKWPDGAGYVGEYCQGMKNGIGKFTWSDGSVYEGEFYENMMQGQGTLTKKDGQKYSGEWFANMMNGEGEYIWPDGRKYVGQYKDNKKHGLGTFEWPSKKKFVGFWLNGEMHGRGLILFPDGRQEEGEWYLGDLLTRRTDLMEQNSYQN